MSSAGGSFLDRNSIIELSVLAASHAENLSSLEVEEKNLVHSLAKVLLEEGSVPKPEGVDLRSLAAKLRTPQQNSPDSKIQSVAGSVLSPQDVATRLKEVLKAKRYSPVTENLPDDYKVAYAQKRAEGKEDAYAHTFAAVYLQKLSEGKTSARANYDASVESVKILIEKGLSGKDGLNEELLVEELKSEKMLTVYKALSDICMSGNIPRGLLRQSNTIQGSILGEFFFLHDENSNQLTPHYKSNEPEVGSYPFGSILLDKMIGDNATEDHVLSVISRHAEQPNRTIDVQYLAKVALEHPDPGKAIDLVVRELAVESPEYKENHIRNLFKLLSTANYLDCPKFKDACSEALRKLATTSNDLRVILPLLVQYFNEFKSSDLRLPYLEELLLKYHSFLSPDTKLLLLEELNIDYELAKSFTSEREIVDLIKRCPGLTSLSIEACQYVSEETLKEIGKLRHLRHLKLSACVNIRDPHLKHLMEQTNLESLDLSYCRGITEGWMRWKEEPELYKLLKALNGTLKSLSLASDRYTEIVCLTELFDIVKRMPQLEILDVGGERGLGPINNSILEKLKGCPALRRLNISWHDDTYLGEDSKLNFAILSAYPSLESLDISGFRGEPRSNWADAIAGIKNLKRLEINSMDRKYFNLSLLAEKLAGNTSLKYLDVSKNGLDRETPGLKEFQEIMKRNEGELVVRR